MKNHFFRLFAIFLISCGFESFATHLLGGEIKADKVLGPALTYRITLFNYVNGGPTGGSGSGQLSLGDGTVIDLAAGNFLISSEPLNEEITLNIYEISHTFQNSGIYVISFRDFNRNGGILNIPASVEKPFYVESMIIIDPFSGENTQPEFSFHPIDKAAGGKTFFHNVGAYDLDGDSLAYQLVVPQQSAEANVEDYSFPNDMQHYTGLDYNTANEAMDSQPILGINAITGDLVWDAPGSVGAYSLAIKVEEWRKIGGDWINIGYRIRDMQFTVEDSSNGRPDFNIPGDTCVIAGGQVDISLSTADPDLHEVFFATESEAYNLAGNPAIFTTGSDSDGTGFLDFNWKPACENVRNRPYAVYFKAKDNPPPGTGPGLAIYKTWNLTVAGAPEGLYGQVKRIGEVSLNWSDYFCSAAKSIAIYRIENSFTFPQDNCEPGLPADSGFELIAEVAPDVNSFVDDNNGTDLDPNVNYCYRLVAVFEDNIGGESVASAEFCARPDEGSLVTGVRDGERGPDQEDSVIVYPNPARKTVHIDFNQTGFQQVVLGISDLQGKVFMQQQLFLSLNKHQLSLEGTTPGMYLVWVKTTTGMITRKIVVN